MIYHLPGDELEDVITMITNHFQVNDVKYTIKAAEKGGNFTKQTSIMLLQKMPI